jgi:hypothetical protein
MKSYRTIATVAAMCALAADPSAAFVPQVKNNKALTPKKTKATKQPKAKEVAKAPLNVGSTFDNFRRQQGRDEGKFEVRAGDIVLEPAYSLGYGSLFIGFLLTLLWSEPMCAAKEFGGICPPTLWGTWIGSQFALFGALCAMQAYRLRFIVTKDNKFVIKNVNSDPGAGTFKKAGKAELEDWGENYVVGGKNSWNLNKFINYKFFPNEYFPVLVYFKEIQTPKEKWDMGIGQFDKRDNGQMHWFPAICNCLELKKQWEARGVKKME